MARKKTSEKEVKKVKTKEVKVIRKVVKKSEKVSEKVVEKKEKVRAPKTKKEDTGSVDFQIKNFSDKIIALTKHLKEHPHDFDSRRGLLIMVGKRRRLLNYVKKSEPERYEKIIANLKLKK